MAKSFANSFERVFPTKDLFRGTALAVVLWSSLGSILFCLLLFALALITDLLIGRGEVQVSGQEAVVFQRLTGERIPAATGGAKSAVDWSMRFENHGLLPTVWNARDHFWVQLIASPYRRMPMLRENGSTLLFLILITVMVGLALSVMISRAKALALRTATDVAMRLRNTLHRQTLRLGPSDLEDNSSDEALDLFTGDVDQVRDGLYLWLNRIARLPVLLVLLVGAALLVHPLLAMQCLIPLAACWYLVQREKQRSESVRRLAEDRAHTELRLLAEGLGKTRLVRGFGMEAFEHEQFQIHLERFRTKLASAKQEQRWSRWVIRGLIAVSLIIVLFLVGSKVLLMSDDPNHLRLSAAMLLLVIFACLREPLEGLWNLRFDETSALQAADRIFRYINQIPEVGQAVGAKFLQPLQKSVQFESVSYTLPNKRKLLDRCDLRIPAGEITAIVSVEPLEARTLTYLLPRFIEPQNGRVLIDGEDIAWVTLESLRTEAIYVGGTDPFFTGTVFQNISCGRSDYSLPDVTEAAKETHAHKFITSLPQGYETVLGEHGEQLDAGQSFRLGLARAVLRDPALLIVEEPDTTLDEDTKTLLDDAYNRITRDRTVIFLPSRLSTIRKAKNVVFLYRGKVEATGPHAALVKKSALYRHWEYLQFNEFRSEIRATEPNA